MKKTGIDQRIIRTVSSIKTALLDLLKEKDITKISVKDILARSGCSRPTFYNHFRDKGDLVEHIMNDEVDRHISLVNDFLNDCLQLNVPQDIYRLNEIRYRHIYENQHLYWAFFTYPCFRDFPIRLRNALYKILAIPFQNYYISVLGARDKANYFYTFVMASAFVSSIEFWVQNGFGYSDKRMSEYFSFGFFPLPPEEENPE